MDNYNFKPKKYQVHKRKLHITSLRPDLKAFAPKLPWHDFSFEGGYIFSHLDGQMVGSYKQDEEIILTNFE